MQSIHHRLRWHMLNFCGLLVIAAGCAGNRTATDNGGESQAYQGKRTLSITHTFAGKHPMKVTCTTGMVADLARNIGKDQVKVEQIMGAGVDPHLYQPTPGDMRKVTEADAVFYSGLHLEGKMTEILVHAGKRVPSVGVAEYIEGIIVDEHKIPDPHAWFDVAMWSEAAGVVGETLAKYDQANAETYRKRTEAYRKELLDLHTWAKKEIAAIPEKQRVLVTSHDAFHYMGRAYGIDVKAIQGISTEAEASVKDINDLVSFIVERKIKAVFVESSVNERSMRSLLEGCQAQGHKVVIGGELYSDAMGPAGSEEGTYIGMIRHNVRTIAKALK